MFKFPKLSRLFKSQNKFARVVAKTLSTPAPKRTKPRSNRSRGKTILAEVTGFGSNPGRLIMKLYAPGQASANPPLVVVLHGCGQTAESLDAASGFTTLARKRGFILLYPEQTEGNNARRCFNWFRPSAVARDRGEVMSVHHMIEHACGRHRVDRSRIYIVGLSAGAALVSALVATYPERFAGAAMIAGMPFGAARDAMSALRAMRSGVSKAPGEWGSLVRNVSPTAMLWPPISIWQGSGDRVVNPTNASSSAAQWLDVTGTGESEGKITMKRWGTLTRWKSARSPAVSLYSLDGFGHGLPIRGAATGKRPNVSDPYVLQAAISAPLELLRIWGLKKV
ncbi:PHB depolymerase family esterase [Rhizobium sp. 1399]|uniref:extracellular catalytic domain type 1 short-chain-length polyhydroxyalkanoate depolymerase n=1 Tax=Rhizobium sp. 1399 TaxID=2817758 RepID=UPI00286D646B|nr:PHB depolymerase family esterase [Rhizobium sp. 1399]